MTQYIMILYTALQWQQQNKTLSHKGTTCLTCMGKLWGVYCENLGRKLRVLQCHRTLLSSVGLLSQGSTKSTNMTDFYNGTCTLWPRNIDLKLFKTIITKLFTRKVLCSKKCCWKVLLKSSMKQLFLGHRFDKIHLNSGHGRLTYTPFHTDPSEHNVIRMSKLYQNDSMLSLWYNHDLITLCRWVGIWEVVSWLGFVCFSIYFHILRGCWVHLIYLVPNGVHHPGGQARTTTLEPYHLIESLQLILWFGIARFHLLASYLFNIGSGNGLSPIRCQASTWANVCSLLIKFLETNLEQFWIKIYWFISKNVFENDGLQNGGHIVQASLC